MNLRTNHSLLVNERKACGFWHHQEGSSTLGDSATIRENMKKKKSMELSIQTEQTCNELKLPHKINIFLARVKATLSRCRIAKKPIPRVLAIEIITMSRSCPWQESIVLTVTYG